MHSTLADISMPPVPNSMELIQKKGTAAKNGEADELCPIRVRSPTARTTNKPTRENKRRALQRGGCRYFL